MDRVIRSHSYYTAFLNSAGPGHGYCQPQIDRESCCLFFCAPWKIVPIQSSDVHEIFSNDITSFWFKHKVDGDEEHQDDQYQDNER